MHKVGTMSSSPASDDRQSIPTASEDMLKPSNVSERNDLTNGALVKFHKQQRSRIRSKSESHQPSQEKTHELIGVVVKSAKDRAHDRKPKNLKGSGKPKKGGGGKGTWGKNGAVYEEESDDPKDPNYDSDNESAKDKGVVLQEVIPDLNSVQFDSTVTPVFQEYYDHGITGEVAAVLRELNISHLKHRVVYLAISMALERKGAQREQTSILLSDLYGEKVLFEQDFELGFQALMNALTELKLDTPDAPTVLGQFMARCIADDCLNPCYIQEHLEHPTEIAREALNTANKFLQMRHGIVRLDNVWGHGGGTRPVKTLVKEIVLLIKEYLSSRDKREEKGTSQDIDVKNQVERCVVDLDVPHFHHEIVYETIIVALESGTEDIINGCTDLLRHLYDANMITPEQMRTGFERVFNNIDDLVLDIPRAFKHLDVLLERCCRAHVIPLSLRQKAPSRGRKRYVSEGDFGMSTKPVS